MGRTLLDKIWDAHIVMSIDGGRDVIYIDRHYIHEVTSPVAFEGLRRRGLGVFRPPSVVALADHNTPTEGRHLPIKNEKSKAQLEQFYKNCRAIANIGAFLPMEHPDNGIVHVVGPENGFTLPAMTVVCGDSHTSTHGALSTIAFGIGTSEVEMVLASNCLIMSRPAAMRISVEGELASGVSAKDMALYIINKIGTSGASGYFIEYAGSAVQTLSIEGRMTLCNMSIESGARGGIVAADKKTFDYLSIPPIDGLYSDADAQFGKEYTFDAAHIKPFITWGTNPAQGVAIDGAVSANADDAALKYMGLMAGQKIADIEFDYVFLGSCTNGRLEDFIEFARVVEGHKKLPSITAWLVPGSKSVARAIEAQGIDKILTDAGFQLREPGCSACLAMNDDKIPSGKRCAATSNRNFEGRQGAGARTMLCSPATAAKIAINGNLRD